MGIHPGTINALIAAIRKHGRITIWKAAKIVGRSEHYFRYHVLGGILDDFPDIKFDPKTMELICYTMPDDPEPIPQPNMTEGGP